MNSQFFLYFKGKLMEKLLLNQFLIGTALWNAIISLDGNLPPWITLVILVSPPGITLTSGFPSITFVTLVIVDSKIMNIKIKSIITYTLSCSFDENALRVKLVEICVYLSKIMKQSYSKVDHMHCWSNIVWLLMNWAKFALQMVLLTLYFPLI